MTERALSGHCERFEESRGNLKTLLRGFPTAPIVRDCALAGKRRSAGRPLTGRTGKWLSLGLIGDIQAQAAIPPAPEEGQRFAEVANEFNERIKEMGPNPVRRKVSL